MEPKCNRSILWDMGGLQRFERCIVRASPSGSSTATHNTRISGLNQKPFLYWTVYTGKYGLLYYSLVRSESFKEWGGGGDDKFVPVLGGEKSKIDPRGDLCDQPPGKMS